MTDEGYFFVSRLRKKCCCSSCSYIFIATNSKVLSDEMVVIKTTQNRSENTFRKIKILNSTDNELLLLTNQFDLSADKIDEIYKSKRAIKILFKWMKQHLSIKKLLWT